MSLKYGMKDEELQLYHDEEELEDEEFEFDEEDDEEGVILSDKHGLNPSIDKCLLCGEGHSIVLFGQLPNDEQAPKEVCTGQVCKKCQDKLVEEEEHLFIEFDEQPTGRYAKIPDKYLVPQFVEENKNQRIFYVGTKMFDKLFNNE